VVGRINPNPDALRLDGRAVAFTCQTLIEQFSS
jgi:hypothetical protein